MAVFVLGMHRSGTSAVARTINLLGVSLGEPADLMPATDANPRGYRESSALRGLNDELLERLGGTWSAPPWLEPGWESRAELGALPVRARFLFRSVYRTSTWIWKDPRNCLLLPFWVKTLRIRPVVVLVHRNPLEIWRSLARRDGLSKPTALALWERYTRQALAHASGLPVFVLAYERLLHEPEERANALRSFLVAQGIACDPADRTEIREFVAPELRHAEYGAAAVADDADFTRAQRILFRELGELAEVNEAFRPPDLPPESAATEDLLAERRRLELELVRERRECQRLERMTMSLFDEAVNRARFAPSWCMRQPPAAAPVVRRPDDGALYDRWLEREKAQAGARRARLAERLAALDDQTEISVVMAAPPHAVATLASAIESLRAQIYPRWQLSICAEACEDAVRGILDQASRSDQRVLASHHAAPAALWEVLQTAVDRATGEWIVFLRDGDRLDAEALAEIALAVAAEAETDVLYSDEDAVERSGRRCEPRFKPDWSPDLLLAQPYLGGLLAVRRRLVEQVGGMRPGFDGAEDYDLALRATERARRVTHLPKLLCHRPAHELSNGAGSPSAARRRAAIADALLRRGEEATVEDGDAPGTFRVRRAIRSRPRVSIVIPFRDEPDLLARCLGSIHRSAGYEHWEALLVDNQSWQPETRALLARLESDPRCRLLRYDKPFNWSEINNWAAAQSGGDLLLFLNNDTEACREGWLAAMIEHAQRPEVGAVGARLLYPNGLVQHGGVILGLQGVANHAFRFFPASDPGYLALAKSIRNCSAVTGACMMVRRRVFEEMGRFDECFGVAFNDIDFCLRLRERGYWIVYTPFAELIHFESMTRGAADEIDEAGKLAKRWLASASYDPYFNPNLGRSDFGLALEQEAESCTPPP